MEVLQARQTRGEFGQFVVVRGEEGLRAGLVVQVLDDGPRERMAVEGAHAAADFVEDDEAARGGVVEDVGRRAHLDHGRGSAARQVVAGNCGRPVFGDHSSGAFPASRSSAKSRWPPGLKKARSKPSSSLIALN